MQIPVEMPENMILGGDKVVSLGLWKQADVLIFEDRLDLRRVGQRPYPRRGRLHRHTPQCIRAFRKTLTFETIQNPINRTQGAASRRLPPLDLFPPLLPGQTALRGFFRLRAGEHDDGAELFARCELG